MSDSQDILNQGRELGIAERLPYAGAVTPQQAYALLQADPAIKLVDVRTKAERDWVGQVKINPAQHAAIEWNLYPQGTPNPAFVDELEKITDKNQVVLFLCRSGVRSRHAAKAATERGYTNCFDILQGFEGNKDIEGHRKTIEGWCFARLPWTGA
ncbi:MAG TPA: rhodanese-like domain-containing protein [Herbaspirillum sp.]|jgi:rhodanese-related sulfurtransferase